MLLYISQCSMFQKSPNFPIYTIPVQSTSHSFSSLLPLKMETVCSFKTQRYICHSCMASKLRKKIQTGGMFWWKEMWQLTPSLKKALIWQHLTCVVFPDPVSPLMSNSWLLLIEWTISSLIDQIGRACLNGSNSRFIAAYGTCGIPLFKRPIHLFISFTEKSKLN